MKIISLVISLFSVKIYFNFLIFWEYKEIKDFRMTINREINWIRNIFRTFYSRLTYSILNNGITPWFCKKKCKYIHQGRIQGEGAHRIGNNIFLLWFFTRNTPKILAPFSAQRHFFSATPPPNLKSRIRPCTLYVYVCAVLVHTWPSASC